MFNQPDEGSQVHCLIDHQGEDDCILGASYSKEDKTPTKNGNLTKAVLGGADLEIDKSSGSATLKFPGGLTIEGPVKITGQTAIEGSGLTHNGKNVGDIHGHVSAPPGPPGPPV